MTDVGGYRDRYRTIDHFANLKQRLFKCIIEIIRAIHH